MFTCDRCGPNVRASIVAVSGTVAWNWRGHHARQHKAKLEAAGFTLVELMPAREREPEPA